MYVHKYKKNIPQISAIRYKHEKTDENFTALYKATHKIIYSIVKRYIYEPENIDDIISNVYIIIFLKMDTFNEDFLFINWIFPIVRNECITFKKNKYNKYILSVDFETREEDKESYSAKIDADFEMFDKQDDEVIEDKQINLLFDIMDNVPASWKGVIFDRHLNNLSMSQLSEKYGLCENTVKQNLFKGRNWIKDQYRKRTGLKFKYLLYEEN